MLGVEGYKGLNVNGNKYNTDCKKRDEADVAEIADTADVICRISGNMNRVSWVPFHRWSLLRIGKLIQKSGSLQPLP